MALGFAKHSSEDLYIRSEVKVKPLFYYIVQAVVRIWFKCTTLEEFRETWIRKLFVYAARPIYKEKHDGVYLGKYKWWGSLVLKCNLDDESQTAVQAKI